MPLVNKGQLANALLGAETVFTQAQSKNEVERTELSRRILATAEEQLRAAEEAAKDANGQLELELRCQKCAWVVTPYRWRMDGVHVDGATEAGVEVVPVYGSQGWEVEFAVQGCEQVTKYQCPECQSVLAVLADDPSPIGRRG